MVYMSQDVWTRDLPDYFYLTSENSFSSYNPSQNQGWILNQYHGNPPALVIQPDLIDNSTFFKIFPIFSEGSTTVINPADFIQPPHLIEFQANLVEYSFSPFKDIKIKALNWVPDPTLICGIFRIMNDSKQTRTIRIDLAGQLTAQTLGNRMTVINNLGRDFLAGQMGSRFPVIFMSGNTKGGKGPYSCLSSPLNIKPEQDLEIRWISVLGDSLAEALKTIDTINQLNWMGEISRSKIQDQSQIKIITGNPAWNFAFKLSQKQAVSFMLRQFPQGQVSPAPRGLSALKAIYLLNALTPIDPQNIPLIVENVMDAVQDNGMIRERSCTYHKTLPALPFAAELVWQADQFAPGRLQKNILVDQLKKSLNHWFLRSQDQDQDGIPELIHPCQVDLMDNRSLDSILKKEFTMPDSFVESPGLAAILINDLTRLEELQISLENNKKTSPSDNKKKKLNNFLQESWDTQKSCFLSRDRDSHLILPGRIIGNDLGNGFHIFREKFPQPTRLGMLIEDKSGQDPKLEIKITLHGQDWKGNYRVEKISPAKYHWGENQGWAVSECIYQQLDYVLVENLGYDLCLNIYSPKTFREDIFQVLPLWGRSLDKQKVDSLINNTLTNKDGFWSNYGIGSIPDLGSAAVQLPWNLLIGRSLVHYDKRLLAADLFSKIMDAILVNLDDSGCFFSAYDAQSGKGIGQKNALEGLVPIGFFLELVGIRFLNEKEILIEGEYPFPWPVTISFRGRKILRDQDMTRIDFPGDKTRFIHGSEKEIIQLN